MSAPIALRYLRPCLCPPLPRRARATSAGKVLHTFDLGQGNRCEGIAFNPKHAGVLAFGGIDRREVVTEGRDHHYTVVQVQQTDGMLCLASLKGLLPAAS